jgi:hypothetical protein
MGAQPGAKTEISGGRQDLLQRVRGRLYLGRNQTVHQALNHERPLPGRAICGFVMCASSRAAKQSIRAITASISQPRLPVNDPKTPQFRTIMFSGRA